MEMNINTAKAIASYCVIAIVNLLAMFNVVVDVSDPMVQVANTMFSVALVLIATFVGCYKNHDFTKIAQDFTARMRMKKESEKLGEKEGDVSDFDDDGAAMAEFEAQQAEEEVAVG